MFINEHNLIAIGNDTAGAPNLVRIFNNYCGRLNYGIICNRGSDTQIYENSLSVTSCYAIYAENAKLLNINRNYFERSANGQFWVQKDVQVVYDINVTSLASFLANEHVGSNNLYKGY